MPPLVSQFGPGGSSSATAWAPTFLRGDRAVFVEDSAGSLETAIALAQRLMLLCDMAKEKESSFERLERTAVLHSIRVRNLSCTYLFFPLAFGLFSDSWFPPFSPFRRWSKSVHGPDRGMLKLPA